MKITQGTFSFLPDLTDEEIKKQVEYCLANAWPMNIEYTDDPHPRNSYWEMWDLPMFDLKDAAAILFEINECRKTFPNHYIKVNGYNVTRGTETIALSFLVNRPKQEPGFRLVRQEGRGRNIQYVIQSYSTDKPEGERYTTQQTRSQGDTRAL